MPYFNTLLNIWWQQKLSNDSIRLLVKKQNNPASSISFDIRCEFCMDQCFSTGVLRVASKGSAESNWETGSKRHLRPVDAFSGLLVRLSKFICSRDSAVVFMTSSSEEMSYTVTLPVTVPYTTMHRTRIIAQTTDNSTVQVAVNIYTITKNNTMFDVGTR